MKHICTFCGEESELKTVGDADSASNAVETGKIITFTCPHCKKTQQIM